MKIIRQSCRFSSVYLIELHGVRTQKAKHVRGVWLPKAKECQGSYVHRTDFPEVCRTGDPVRLDTISKVLWSGRTEFWYGHIFHDNVASFYLCSFRKYPAVEIYYESR